MGLTDIILLSVALAMDCFTVSIVSGVLLQRFEWRVSLQMGILFGLFQALMPLIGWLGISSFAHYLEAVDHWIAFGLLLAIGLNMIRGAFSSEEERPFNPCRLRTQLLLAIATSIDALAVGITMGCTGYTSLPLLALPLSVIGLGSLLFSLLGFALGVRFGRPLAHRVKPELLGGVILIFIGCKILIQHLGGSIPLL
ncbi:MAG: manganese efflux pump [Prevotella sp.]|nr:manganese efflux pump [Prevotella sp.]